MEMLKKGRTGLGVTIKKILRPKIYLVALLVSLLLVPPTSFAGVLGVPQTYQEMTEWCWGACSEAVLGYYEEARTQTEIAQYGTVGANIWNWLYGTSTNPTRNGVNLILNHFGQISSVGCGAPMPEASVQDEIDGGRPIVIRWLWASGGGHHVVVRGIEESTLYLMDPWNGPTINSYAWVLQGSNHTWTDSLRLTTNPEHITLSPPMNLRIEGTSTLVWDPVSGDIAGYRIHYSTVPGSYSNSVDVGNLTRYSLHNLALPANTEHHFVATVYKGSIESAFSNEVSWTPSSLPPPAPPRGFRIQ
jgi:hypothetical protein